MDRQRIKFEHIVLAFVPVGMTPALAYLLAEGWVDLGGGEKDIVLAIPFFLLAFTFFVVSTVLIVKRWPMRKWALRAAMVAFSVVLAMASVAYLASLLGVA